MELDASKKFQLTVYLSVNGYLVKKQIDVISLYDFRNHYQCVVCSLQSYYNESLRRLIELCIDTYLLSNESVRLSNLSIVDNSATYDLQIAVDTLTHSI